MWTCPFDLLQMTTCVRWILITEEHQESIKVHLAGLGHTLELTKCGGNASQNLLDVKYKARYT